VFTIFFLRVIHEGRAFLHPLTDHRAGGDDAVRVEDLDPVIVDQPRLFRIDLGDPDYRAAAVQRQHVQVVRIGRVDAPFLVRGDEVQDDMLFTVLQRFRRIRADGLQIDRRTPVDEAFAEGAHPFVILVKLLAAGQSTPG
jgi:hypothetical protein